MEEPYFFQQAGFHYPTKRFRKLPEDLPDSLKFAHLNPRVAAYLASKEKQKQEEDLFGDGLGKKSLMPEINQAFQHVKNHLDTTLSNDEDSQRYLFEEARRSALSILYQLGRIIYNYESLGEFIPKSLEYQLMLNYKDLTADVIHVPREWQTIVAREMFNRKVTDIPSDDDKQGIDEDGRSTRTDKQDKLKKKVPKSGLPEIVEDEDSNRTTGIATTRRSDSKQSGQSKKPGMSRADRGKNTLHADSSRLSVAGSVRSPGNRRGYHEDYLSALTETPSDARYSSMTTMGNPSYYMCTIQFQLSSKQCEEKGWIVQKGKEDEIARETLLEWCVQILQHCMKITREQYAQEIEIGFDKPAQVRYYGDTRKETLLKYRKSPVKPSINPAVRGQKPRIPHMYDDRNEGKQLMLTSHVDGTTVAYYPSGRPAVVSSGAGYGRPGYYTIAYTDDLDMKMLACFTPVGKGCCYHPNGVVKFLATEKGGHLAEDDGTVSQKWKWPHGNVKITSPVSFQINSFLTFRCVSQSSMVLHFNCMKESAKFPVGPVPGAVEPRQGDENEQLLTTFTFSSRAAKELLRLFAPKTKTKSKSKKKDKYKGQLAELQKMMEVQDQIQYDTEADKELARLQRKARNLVDDWLEHYRLALEMCTPTLNSLQDMPSVRRRYAQSARLAGDVVGSTRRGLVSRSPDTSNVFRTLRAPSAPAGNQKRDSSMAESRQPSPNRSSMVKFEEKSEMFTYGQGDERTVSPTAVSVMRRLSEVGSRAQSALGHCKSPTRQNTNMSLPERIRSATLYHSTCPLAVRQFAMTGVKSQCRCNRYAMPNITDIEFDEFILREAPPSQLQIVCAVSSLYPHATGAEDMLNHLYNNMNRNRTRPCTQCRGDTYRIFKYDINTAADMSDHTQPLLLTRHNVVPGMFLIYADGRLLFCDHIFNGYGNTSRKDFKKQIMKSRLDSLQGFSLPKDFRFSPSRGRHGARSAWGGEIGGAGVDNYGSPGTSVSNALMPRLHSSDSGEGPSLDKVKDLHPVAKLISLSLSLSPISYRPTAHLTSPLKQQPIAHSIPGTTG
ncbi:uncharacterized protein LOC124136360 isoform X1 [Haliotis rufescens]|uniref:uncharacterized protein LOC124136360 isoform X1 n=1 Tax=Haliotis rufescens TaxID=6454 RepID=UPI00201F876F|nr:uncharacterized protein LOC124136360 isoform X1 [Haliotis rufescens]